MPEVAVVIVAAGSSRRMGFDKLTASLVGEPVVIHSVRAFCQVAEVRAVVVVTRADRVEEFSDLFQGVEKVTSVVAGGTERHLSVWNGLQALPADIELVAVHDGARPLITPRAIRQCIGVAHISGAACCAAPVSDTLKHGTTEQIIDASVDRSGMWTMQTPQIFYPDVLRSAYESVLDQGGLVTDEASAVQEAGGAVSLVHSEDWNLKITYPQDVDLASAVLEHRRAGGRF